LILKGWQKTSLIEYPGKISTVVFTGGCNFRCPFCYNAELVERPHQLSDLDSDIVLNYLKENAGLHQAVVITGGEPTLNGETPEFLAQVKDLGLYAGLETNGTNPKMIAHLLEQNLLDYIAMDVKAPLEWDDYSAAAGLTRGREDLLENVKQTLEHLKSARVEIELRCTVVPFFHTPEDILRLAGQLQGYPRFVLQKFAPERALDLRLRDQKPFSDQVLGELHEKVSRIIPSCEVRGI